jgi:hypothetical protein
MTIFAAIQRSGGCNGPNPEVLRPFSSAKCAKETERIRDDGSEDESPCQDVDGDSFSGLGLAGCTNHRFHLQAITGDRGRTPVRHIPGARRQGRTDAAAGISGIADHARKIDELLEMA